MVLLPELLGHSAKLTVRETERMKQILRTIMKMQKTGLIEDLDEHFSTEEIVCMGNAD
jgi:hypothetical protein